MVNDNLENEIKELQKIVAGLANDICNLSIIISKLEKKNGWNWLNIQHLKDGNK